MNWKGELIQAITFVAMPCLGVLATWLALRVALLDRLTLRRWTLVATSLFLLTRVGTHVLVFSAFGYAGGDDLLRVWEPIARSVLHGQDPLPHMDNLYGPFFPLVLGFGYAVTGGSRPECIDFPFVIADALALLLLYRIANRRFEGHIARRLTLAVLLSPLLWHNEIVRTQDESLFLFFLLLVLDLFDQGKDVPGSIAAAMGTICTKAVFPLWVFPVLIAMGGTTRALVLRVVGAGLLTVVGMSAFWILGWDFLGSFRPAIDVRGTTSWFLLPGGADASPALFRSGLLATVVLGASAGWYAVRRNPTPHQAMAGVLAAQAVFFVVCPFTLPPHLVQGLPFALWLGVREGACLPRPSWKGVLIGAGFTLWQIPSIWLNSEYWREYPWLIVAFVVFLAWTGWVAVNPRDSKAPDMA